MQSKLKQNKTKQNKTKQNNNEKHMKKPIKKRNEQKVKILRKKKIILTWLISWKI